MSMPPPAQATVRLDGSILSWSGDVEMHHIVLDMPIPGKKEHQFNIERIGFNGSGSSPTSGTRDISSLYPFAIESMFEFVVGSSQDTQRLPTRATFRIGVSPRVFCSANADGSTDRLVPRPPRRQDVPDEYLREVVFNPREWAEKALAQKDAQHHPGTNGARRGWFTTKIANLLSKASRLCTNGTMIDPTEIIATRDQRPPSMKPAPVTTTEVQTTTDKPTTKETKKSMSTNQVNMPRVTQENSERELILTIAPDAAIHSYLIGLHLGAEKVGEATENPVGDNKPTTIKIPECLATTKDLVPGTLYKLEVIAMDQAGNRSTPWNDQIRFDAKQLGIEQLPPAPKPAPVVPPTPTPAPQPVPAPKPTPAPAPEKSPEDKVLDAQESQLGIIKADMTPPKGKKPDSQEWSWLSNSFRSLKGILSILNDPKFTNNERARKLATEAESLRKEINRARIGKWGRWPELRELLDSLNRRVLNLGHEEGQPGHALMSTLQQIEKSVHRDHWDALEVSMLEKALADADTLRISILKIEDEVIIRSKQMAEELAKQQAAAKNTSAEIDKLRADLEEARKKVVQPPTPNQPPAKQDAPAPARVKQAEPATTEPKSATPPRAPSQASQIVVAIIALAALIVAVILATLQWTGYKQRMSEMASASTGTIASATPPPSLDQIPPWADPRMRAYHEALARFGVLSGISPASWSSNSTMNSSSNYIGGDSLVNGSFMIKYVLPPTNQPVIIYTNADVPQLQPARTNSCVDQHPHDNGANITSIDIGSDAAAQIGDIKDWEEVVDPGEAIEINIARGTKICFGLSTISSFEVSVDVGGTYVLWTPTPESPMSDKHIPHARVRLKPGVNRPETLYLRGLCVASK